MNPGDIQLAPERKPPEKAPVERIPVAQPISFEEFKKIEATSEVSKFEGRRVFGPSAGITDFNDIPLYYYTACVRFDLKEEEDRQRYADLVSETMSPNSPINVIWDDRVIDGGSMIMYITYSEQIRIVGLNR